ETRYRYCVSGSNTFDGTGNSPGDTQPVSYAISVNAPRPVFAPPVSSNSYRTEPPPAGTFTDACLLGARGTTTPPAGVAPVTPVTDGYAKYTTSSCEVRAL